MHMEEHSDGQRKIWTVTGINGAARDTLADAFSRILVEGEISNFRLYPSGHAYFSLKDEECQLAAVMFRYSGKGMKFEVKDGLAVVAAGDLTIYDKRGQYQLVVAEVEPKGKGALQLAFEQLKARLQAEGLFDEDRKKALPFFPRTVGVVTSPRGAAIRDIVNVLRRRFAGVRVLLNPVRVQGEGAAVEIAAAIREFNAMGGADVLIVGRGGGSTEDLWAFNEEVVARAIAESGIPVVSAVGHEVDFTIADFVADLRAATPSAAAELVVRNARDLSAAVEALRRGLAAAASKAVGRCRHRLDALAVHRMISDTRRRVMVLAQRSDDLEMEMRRAIELSLSERRRALKGARESLAHLSPRSRQAVLREKTRHLAARLQGGAAGALGRGRERVSRLAAQLEALSPLAVLGRGYSICRRLPGGEVVKDSSAVHEGGEVSVRLHRGELHCLVTAALPPAGGDADVDR